MDDQNERWADVGSLTSARLVELGLKQRDLVERTGLSRETVGPIIRGRVGNYRQSNLALISKALRWTPDSIERILAGLGPIDQDAMEEVWGIEHEIEVCSAEVERLSELMHTVRGPDVKAVNAQLVSTEQQLARLRIQLVGAERRAFGEDARPQRASHSDRLVRLEAAVEQLLERAGLDPADFGLRSYADVDDDDASARHLEAVPVAADPAGGVVEESVVRDAAETARRAGRSTKQRVGSFDPDEEGALHERGDGRGPGSMGTLERDERR